MAKSYRSRVDKRNHRRALNAARRDKPYESGLANVLTSAKNAVKSVLGF
jgi:hypothetical protein